MPRLRSSDALLRSCATCYADGIQYASINATEAAWGGELFKFPWSSDAAMATLSRKGLGANSATMSDCALCWSGGQNASFDPAFWQAQSTSVGNGAAGGTVAMANASQNFARMVNPQPVVTAYGVTRTRANYTCFDCWVRGVLDPDSVKEDVGGAVMWRNDVALVNLFFFMLSNLVLMVGSYLWVQTGRLGYPIAAQRLVKAYLARQRRSATMTTAASAKRGGGGEAAAADVGEGGDGEADSSGGGLGTSKSYFVVQAKSRLTADEEHAVNGVYEANHLLPLSDGAPQYTLAKDLTRAAKARIARESAAGAAIERWCPCADRRAEGRGAADDLNREEDVSRFVIRRVRRLKTRALMWSHWIIMDLTPEGGLGGGGGKRERMLVEQRLRTVDAELKLVDDDVVFAAPVCSTEQQAPPEGNWRVEAHEKDVDALEAEGDDSSPLLDPIGGRSAGSYGTASSVVVMKQNQALYRAELEAAEREKRDFPMRCVRHALIGVAVLAIVAVHATYLHQTCSTRRAESILDLPPVAVAQRVYVRAACLPADRWVGAWYGILFVCHEIFIALAVRDGLITSPLKATVMRTLFRVFILGVLDLSMWPMAQSLCYLVCVFVASDGIYKLKYREEDSVYSVLRFSLRGAMPSWMLGGAASSSDESTRDTSRVSQSLRSSVAGVELRNTVRATLDYVVGGGIIERSWMRIFSFFGNRASIMFLHLTQCSLALFLSLFGARVMPDVPFMRRTPFFTVAGLRQGRWAALTIMLGLLIQQAVALHHGLRHFGHKQGRWPRRWVLQRWFFRMALPSLVVFAPLTFLVMQPDYVGHWQHGCEHSLNPTYCPTIAEARFMDASQNGTRIALEMVFIIAPFFMLAFEWWSAEFHATDYDGPRAPFVCCIPCPPICRCLFMCRIIRPEGASCGEKLCPRVSEEEESTPVRRRRTVWAALAAKRGRCARILKLWLAEFFLRADNMLATLHFLLAAFPVGTILLTVWENWLTSMRGSLVLADTHAALTDRLSFSVAWAAYVWCAAGAVLYGLVVVKKLRFALEFATPSFIFFFNHLVLLLFANQLTTTDQGATPFNDYVAPILAEQELVNELGALPLVNATNNREIIERLRHARYPYGYPFEAQIVSRYIAIEIGDWVSSCIFGLISVTILFGLLQDDNWSIPQGAGICTCRRLGCCRLNRRRIVQLAFVCICGIPGELFLTGAPRHPQNALVNSLYSVCIWSFNLTAVVATLALYVHLDQRGAAMAAGGQRRVNNTVTKVKNILLGLAIIILVFVVVGTAGSAAYLDTLDRSSAVVTLGAIFTVGTVVFALMPPIWTFVGEAFDANKDIAIIGGFAFAFDKMTGVMGERTQALRNVWKIVLSMTAVANIVLLFPAPESFGIEFQKYFSYAVMVLMVGVPSIAAFVSLELKYRARTEFKGAFDQLKVQDPSKFAEIVVTVANKLKSEHHGRARRVRSQADRMRDTAALWGVSESFYTRCDAAFGVRAALFHSGDKIIFDAGELSAKRWIAGRVVSVNVNNAVASDADARARAARDTRGGANGSSGGGGDQTTSYNIVLVFDAAYFNSLSETAECNVPASRLRHANDAAAQGCEIEVYDASAGRTVLYELLAQLNPVWSALLLAESETEASRSTAWRRAAFERDSGRSFTAAVDALFVRSCAKSHGCASAASRDAVELFVDGSAPPFTSTTAVWESRVQGVYVALPFGCSASVWTASDDSHAAISVEMNDAPVRVLQRMLANCPTHPSDLIGCAVMYRSADGTWSIGPPTDLVYLEAQRQPWLRSTENDDGAHCPKGLTWEVLPMKKREQLRPWRLRSPMRASARVGAPIALPTPFQARLLTPAEAAAAAASLPEWKGNAARLGAGLYSFDGSTDESDATLDVRVRVPLAPSAGESRRAVFVTITGAGGVWNRLSGRFVPTLRIKNGGYTYVHEAIGEDTPFVFDDSEVLARGWSSVHLTRSSDGTRWVIGPADAPEGAVEVGAGEERAPRRPCACCAAPCASKKAVQRVWLRAVVDTSPHADFFSGGPSADRPTGFVWEALAEPTGTHFAPTTVSIEMEAEACDSGALG